MANSTVGSNFITNNAADRYWKETAKKYVG